MPSSLDQLRQNISAVIFGGDTGINRVLCCLLARGHVLIEDVPGVGKTLLATALAKSVDCTFTRIQLTPDLLPSDILGVTVYDKTSGEFHFRPGPLFANIVLADEINRTPPRTQSALLEAMSDGAVSIDGRVLPLTPPFMVVATQNPFEFEGTYPLPENQLDRFLMRVSLGYPSPADEARVLQERPSQRALQELKPVIHREDVIRMQAEVDAVRMQRSLVDYIVMLANGTRNHPAVIHGLSPRGALALSQAAKAWAYLQSRDYVVPDDITGLWTSVCGHRIVSRRSGGEVETNAILREVLESIPNPA